MPHFVEKVNDKDMGTCPHGNFFGNCPECRREQPAIATVERLAAQSRFKRSTLDSPNAEVEIGEKKYKIEQIESKEHPDLAKVQALLERTFGKEEVDPEEIMRNAVEGTTAWGTEDITKYRIYVLKDEKGEVQSLIAGGLLELQDESGRETDESMFMIGYAVTNPDARQGGLAREAYISAIIGATQDAQHKGKKLGFAAGECTYTSERFWNSVGWKRPYGQVGEDKRSYEELRYIQPALDFEKSSGKEAADAGEAPEHLMIDSFGHQPPTKEQILETVDAFYRWCNKWPREAFDSDEAYQTHLHYVDGIKAGFKQQLDSLGQVILLDKTSRDKALATGVKIKEHTEAEHGNAGKEDF